MPIKQFSPTTETPTSSSLPSNSLNLPDSQPISLDIETSRAEDSFLKKLELKSIQLDNQFIPITFTNKPDLIRQLRNKELIVFNSPFEQTQLARQGFDI